MPISEAIILAGGLGTRLRGVIGEMPKCMASVAGRPFLHYILQYLERQKITRAIISLGYKSDVVTDWLAQHKRPFTIDWVIEESPMGTGGGIQLALGKCNTTHVAILNGDTMFDVDIQAMSTVHCASSAEATLALKAMKNFDRYGIVKTGEKSEIISFEEKAPRTSGSINGGVYLIDRDAFLKRGLPNKFSFEKDYLERFVAEQKFFGWPSESYFIDIGVPHDYELAQEDFKTPFPAS